jgi:hypothetical protein
MGRLPRIRRCLGGAPVAVGATLALAVPAAPAGATDSVVECTTVTGSQVSAALVFNCSPFAQTGGSGSIPKPVPFFSGGQTGTIYWAVESGGTTTTEIHIHTRVVPRKKTACPSGSTMLKVGGRVRADTSGAATVGGPVSATLCQASGGAFSLLANTAFVIG